MNGEKFEQPADWNLYEFPSEPSEEDQAENIDELNVLWEISGQGFHASEENYRYLTTLISRVPVSNEEACDDCHEIGRDREEPANFTLPGIGLCRGHARYRLRYNQDDQAA
jgi:hypothetical protein